MGLFSNIIVSGGFCHLCPVCPQLFKTSGEMPWKNKSEASPERKTSETAEETLLETGPEVEEKVFIVNSDEDMLPDI